MGELVVGFSFTGAGTDSAQRRESRRCGKQGNAEFLGKHVHLNVLPGWRLFAVTGFSRLA
jgi:hypothetical protein